MSTKSLGKVTITPKGAWNSSYTYKRLDVVTNAGASFVALTDVPANTATSNGSYWMKLAAKGESVASVAAEKTDTTGAVDTYTVTFTYTDESTDTITLTVTNGSVTSVAGKTGAVTLGAGDVGYDATASYTSATVGGEVSALKSAIDPVLDALEYSKINITKNILNTSKAIGKTLAELEESTYTTVLPLDWSNGEDSGTYKLTIVFDNSGTDYTPTCSFTFQPLDANKQAYGPSYNIASATGTGISLTPTYYSFLKITAYADRTLPIKKLGLTIGTYEEYEVADNFKIVDTVNKTIKIKNANVYEDVLTNGYIKVDTGEFVSGSTTKVTDYLPVIGGKTLVSAYKGAKNEAFFIACFDSTKAIIPEAVSAQGDGKQRLTGYFVLPEECAYVRVTYVNANAHAQNKLYLLDTVDYDPTDPVNKFLVLDDGTVLPYSQIVTAKNVDALIEAVNNKSRRFYNSKIVAYGDSVTNGQAWFSGVAEHYGNAPVNLGVPGSTVIDLSNGFCTDARIATIPTDTDLILVMGGINDWYTNTPIGDKTVTNTNTSTFCGAVNVMIQKMIARVPNAKIICMGATYGMYPNGANFNDPTGIYNNHGLSTIDYGRAFADMCKLNGVESFVIGESCGWNANNISTYVTNDGAYLHPNAAGGARMADVIFNEIG